MKHLLRIKYDRNSSSLMQGELPSNEDVINAVFQQRVMFYVQVTVSYGIEMA